MHSVPLGGRSQCTVSVHSVPLGGRSQCTVFNHIMKQCTVHLITDYLHGSNVRVKDILHRYVNILMW